LFDAGAVIAQRQLDDGWLEVDVSLRRQDLERICRDAGLEVPADCSPCAGAGRFLQSTGSGLPGVRLDGRHRERRS
jgi:hypothetical protein